MDYVSANWPSKSKLQKCIEFAEEADTGKDRISDLPDEILLEILSYLPGKQIVATSILSKSWKPLCTALNILNFDFDSKKEKEKENNLGRRHTISLDSIQRKLGKIPPTARIAKFRLHISPFFHSPDKEMKLTSLLSDVVRHKVEELDLSLSHSLFTCESLTSLKLTAIDVIRLEFPAAAATSTSIRSPSLKTLHLICTHFPNENSVQLLLSACLVLEELLLHDCSWRNISFLTISIPTLKRLSIFVNHSSISRLKICIPNIQSFKWASDHLVELVLRNLPSSANVDFSVLADNSICKAEQVADPYRLEFCKTVWGNSTIGLIEKFCGVKSLTVSHITLELICCAEKYRDDDHLLKLYSLTHLKVSYSDIAKSCLSLSSAALIHFLRKSPNLQSLEFPDGLVNMKDEENQILKDDAVPVPLCLSTCLKTLTISEFKGGEKEVKFLKYILKNANGEDFTFCCNGIVGAIPPFVDE